MTAASTIAIRLEKHSVPEPNTGCILWTATGTQNGYALVGFNGETKLAHRVAYELANGPIPDGLEIDHKCRVRCCINPEHLEVVTHAENVSRGGNSKKTHCRYGHALPTTKGSRLKPRRCEICSKTRQSTPNSQTHCKRGHELSGSNLYIRKTGKRLCRDCNNESTRKSKQRLRNERKQGCPPSSKTN